MSTASTSPVVGETNEQGLTFVGYRCPVCLDGLQPKPHEHEHGGQQVEAQPIWRDRRRISTSVTRTTYRQTPSGELKPVKTERSESRPVVLAFTRHAHEPLVQLPLGLL